MANNKKSGYELMNIINRVPKTTGKFIKLNGRNLEVGFFTRSHVDKLPMIYYGNVCAITKFLGGDYIVTNCNVAPVAGGYLVEVPTGIKYRVLGRAFHFVSADDLNGRVFHETRYQYDKLNSICDALNNGLLNADDLKFVFTL